MAAQHLRAAAEGAEDVARAAVRGLAAPQADGDAIAAGVQDKSGSGTPLRRRA
jgi:hypothetical protein